MVWNMLRQLSSSHENGHSMAIYNSYRKYAPSVVIASWQRSEYDYTLSRMSHALSVAIISWQWPEHGYSSLRYKPCSVSCYCLVTTVRAWLFISKIWNMLRQFSSSHDNGQSMGIHSLGMKHAPLVVIASWQRSEHGYSSLRYETCSDSCHRLMTTVRAWLFIMKVWNMLQQLSSWHDNGQSMVIRL